MQNAKNLLKGWQVVILRAPHQAKTLCEQVALAEGHPIVLPTVDIIPISFSAKELAQHCATLKAADLIIVVSANAIYCAPAEMINTLAERSLVTMGESTTQSLLEKKLNVFYTAPPGTSSESLLTEPFLQASELRNKNIVVLSGSKGRELIVQTLKLRGARVNKITVYEQRNATPSLALEKLAIQAKTCFVALSVNSLESLITLIPQDIHPWLFSRPCVVISPRIAQFAKERGFAHLLVATDPYPPAIMDVLLEIAEIYDSMV